MFQVEKGVPIPERISKSKYPFSIMEVGDSFAVTEETFGGAQSYGYKYARANKEKNIKFSFSKKHLRIWRVS
jgi:hypothetical protein